MISIIDENYLIDEGGSAEFYLIKENPKIGFKQFKNKKFAQKAIDKQLILSKFNLAPKVYSRLCRLNFRNTSQPTNWGFLTERAILVDEKKMVNKLGQIQILVENIYEKTKLKFWDCHYYNIGYIKRNNKAKLVCIDTGSESFHSNSNAWGFSFPGPKCNYCKKFQCVCLDY